MLSKEYSCDLFLYGALAGIPKRVEVEMFIKYSYGSILFTFFMMMYLGTKQLKLVNAYVIKSNNIRSLQSYAYNRMTIPSQSLHRMYKQSTITRSHHTPLSMMASSSIATNNNWEYITNHKTSKTVKLFKSVLRANKSKRYELGLTVAEGVRLVTDILANEESRRLVRRIVVSEEIDYTDEYQQKLGHWLSIVDEESRQNKEAEQIDGTCSINIGTSEVVTACSGTVTSQGVVALLDVPPQYNPKDDNIASPPNNNSIPPFYLILDGLSDPGNVGTLLRSCKASYVTACILLPGSCDVFNPKAVRSAMGASFSVPILEISKTSEQEALEEVLKLLEDFGIDNSRVFAATMESSGSSNNASLAHYDVNFCSAAAVILGKEGEGLRSPVLNAIKQGKISTVHVPMAEGIESLNAAVCGSVIMFERMRQIA